MRHRALVLLALAACGDVLKVQPDAPPPMIDAAPDSPSSAPKIIMVNVPASLDAEGATANVSVIVQGQPSEPLTVTLTGTLGSYSPASTTVMTDAAGNAMMTSVFTSGAVGGTAGGTAIVKNAQDVSSTPRDFGFPVVPLRRLGFPTQLPTAASFGSDFLLGETITVAAPGHLKKFGWISANSTPSIKIGIYTDAAGSPGTLVTQMPARVTAAGVNEVALATPLALAAGTYWFMAVYSTGASVYTDSAQNRTIKYVALPFANALPTTFPAPMTYNGNNFNYYFVMGQ